MFSPINGTVEPTENVNSSPFHKVSKRVVFYLLLETEQKHKLLLIKKMLIYLKT